MADTIRWGILGTGGIAHKFADGLSALPDAELVAVGSRAQGSADAFAEEYGVSHRHATYDALAEDAEVDVVYVSTPHPMHKDNSILCLQAGKAVLCEKPFTINARETEEVIRVAREKKLFLMEAMWTRFLPSFGQVRTWLDEGRIGDIRMVQANFGYRADLNPKGRLFNPELGGGGLLDVGIYTVSLASFIFGEPPAEISGFADIGETGVDEQSVTVFRYPEGNLALLSCAVRTNTPYGAHIFGTEGTITLDHPVWRGAPVTLSVQGEEAITADLPLEGNGYNYEAAAAMTCLRAGELESKVMPLDESLEIMNTLDRIRAHWGLVYPMEL